MMTLPFPMHRVAVVAVCVGMLAGCSRPPAPAPAAARHDHDDHHDHDHDDHHDHDHGDHDHDHPTTLAEGIAALARAADAVKDHLADDAADAVDDAVHDLGHLLEDLQGFVRKEGLSAEAKAAATQAIDELFECFDKLDTALHAEPGTGEPPRKVHASVAGRIAAAIGSLRKAASAPTADEDEATAIVRGAGESKEN